MAVINFDTSSLLNYYASKLTLGSQNFAASGSVQTNAAQTLTPWDIRNRKQAQSAADVAARSATPYFDPKNTALFAKASTAAANANSQLEAILKDALSKPQAGNAISADNAKLFALYKALERLDTIALMSAREGVTAGQLPGLDASFQNGLAQVLSYVKTASFNNLTLMPGKKTGTVQSTASVPYAPFAYTGKGIAPSSSVAIPGLSASDVFTVSITKGGVKTDVNIDLSEISGALSLEAVNAHVNQELSSAGFSTRFKRVQTGGDLEKGTAVWGIKIDDVPNETVTLSSAQATPALYLSGTSGKPGNTSGKLVKLTDLDAAPKAQFSASVSPDTGTANVKAAVTDASGNVYVTGTSTGSFGSELNQAKQDAYLSKYDSAGKLLWTKLLGATGTADATGIALDPSGGVVITGSVDERLTPTSIGGGKDSFAARYDKDGNQTWLRQIAPMANDVGNSVSVDASGNVYIAGQVNGTIGAGAVNLGAADAFVTKLDNKGTLVYHRQFGGSGADAASKTAIADDGNLLVASVQDGRAILTKYDAANATAPAIWQIDLGDLQGGTLGGLTVSNGKIYLSGSTSNAALTAGGAASIASANAGGVDAFVFTADDNGTSATPDFISYVGTGASDQGGGVTVVNGTIYLAGTTVGAFAGQTQPAANTHNMFVASLDSTGAVDWARQYGGVDGVSLGASVSADASGTSVLDALGLPRGSLARNQSVELAANMTVRAGDNFTLKLTTPTGTRNATITIAKGETLQSLATKINGVLLFTGKAKTTPVAGGQALQINVNAGTKLELVAGSAGFDALAGLGIVPQMLVNEAADDKTKAANPKAPLTAGLALNTGLNLLDKSSLGHAHVALLGAMAVIKQAYANMNNPSAAGAASGTAPAYVTNQLANYQTALAALQSL